MTTSPGIPSRASDVGLDARPQPRERRWTTAHRRDRRIRGRARCGRRTGRGPGARQGVAATMPMSWRYAISTALPWTKPAALVGARRQQAAVELLGESGRPAGDVAHVDDAVIGEAWPDGDRDRRRTRGRRGTTRPAWLVRSAASTAPRAECGSPARGSGPARRRPSAAGPVGSERSTQPPARWASAVRRTVPVGARRLPCRHAGGHGTADRLRCGDGESCGARDRPARVLIVERVAALHRIDLFAATPGSVLAAVAAGGRGGDARRRRGPDRGGRRRGQPLRDPHRARAGPRQRPRPRRGGTRVDRRASSPSSCPNRARRPW